MEKETIIKLILLCGVSHTTLRRCTYLGVMVKEVEEYSYHIFADCNGRMEI